MKDVSFLVSRVLLIWKKRKEIKRSVADRDVRIQFDNQEKESLHLLIVSHVEVIRHALMHSDHFSPHPLSLSLARSLFIPLTTAVHLCTKQRERDENNDNLLDDE